MVAATPVKTKPKPNIPTTPFAIRSRNLETMGGMSGTKDGSDNKTMTKAEAIFLCLAEEEVDLWKLRELALTNGGLLSSTLRRRAWPKLLGIDRTDLSRNPALAPELEDEKNEKNRSKKKKTFKEDDDAASVASTGTSSSSRPPYSASKRKRKHATPRKAFPPRSDSSKSMTSMMSSYPTPEEMDQVERDVNRCTWHLLNRDQRQVWRKRGRVSSASKKKMGALLRRRQRRLGDVINMVLRDGKGDLKYYQGYHDVSSVVVYNMVADGLDVTRAVLLTLSYSHLRDAMKHNFSDLTTALRLIIFPLLATCDPPLHAHISMSGIEPFFALSWILTWFSHDVRDTNVVSRLFDAFIAGHALLPFYVAVAMVCHDFNRRIILETEPEFAEMHSLLCSLPQNTCAVGWKPNGGYGSTDEESPHDDNEAEEGDGQAFSEEEVASSVFGEQDSVCTEATSSESVSRTVHSFLQEVEASPTTKSASTTNATTEATVEVMPPVPVEELLELAIEYMRKVPPRRLLKLAQNYRGPYDMQPLIASATAAPTTSSNSTSESNSLVTTSNRNIQAASPINLLCPPPAFALRDTVPSDWSQKQLALERSTTTIGGPPSAKKIPSKDRKLLQSAMKKAAANPLYQERSFQPSDISKHCAKARAACGGGWADDDDEKWEIMRRRLLLGGLAVALLSMAWVAAASAGGGGREVWWVEMWEQWRPRVVGGGAEEGGAAKVGPIALSSEEGPLPSTTCTAPETLEPAFASVPDGKGLQQPKPKFQRQHQHSKQHQHQHQHRLPFQPRRKQHPEQHHDQENPLRKVGGGVVFVARGSVRLVRHALRHHSQTFWTKEDL